MARNESRNRTAPLELRILVMYCTERDTLLRSIKTALVIGTILAVLATLGDSNGTDVPGAVCGRDVWAGQIVT